MRKLVTSSGFRERRNRKLSDSFWSFLGTERTSIDTCKKDSIGVFLIKVESPRFPGQLINLETLATTRARRIGRKDVRFWTVTGRGEAKGNRSRQGLAPEPVLSTPDIVLSPREGD
jgi:hypothetical protein